MNKTLVSFMVKKYLSYDKNQPFISIIAILAFVGVTLGVAVLMIAMAIMNGFDKEFQSKLFTMNYPLTIHSKTIDGITHNEYLDIKEKFPDLKFSPYITTMAMIKKGESLSGIKIYGVDLELERKINKIVDIAVGDTKLSKYSAIIGKGLEEELFLNIGDKVTFMFTSTFAAGLSLVPKMKRFKVASVFSSGLRAYDKAYVYTSLQSLQTILKKQTYNGIHIYAQNPKEYIHKIANELPLNLGIVGWWQQNGNFLAAIKMEKTALFLVLMLIILIASINIISSLLMSVMSRRNEIALLLSLGASKKEVKSIFSKLGIKIGMGGIIFGVILGFLGIWILGSFDIINLPKDVYPSSKLPLDLSLLDFMYLVLGSVIVVFISSWYPSKKASQVDILQTLRHE